MKAIFSSMESADIFQRRATLYGAIFTSMEQFYLNGAISLNGAIFTSKESYLEEMISTERIMQCTFKLMYLYDQSNSICCSNEPLGGNSPKQVQIN